MDQPAHREPGALHVFAMYALLLLGFFAIGFAQPALVKRLGFWPGVVLTGALFALIHLDPVGFIGLWELGIVFGLIRHATGSLWCSMLAHAANNGIAATAFLMGMNRPEEV